MFATPPSTQASVGALLELLVPPLFMAWCVYRYEFSLKFTDPLSACTWISAMLTMFLFFLFVIFYSSSSALMMASSQLATENVFLIITSIPRLYFGLKLHEFLNSAVSVQWLRLGWGLVFPIHVITAALSSMDLINLKFGGWPLLLGPQGALPYAGSYLVSAAPVSTLFTYILGIMQISLDIYQLVLFLKAASLFQNDIYQARVIRLSLISFLFTAGSTIVIGIGVQNEQVDNIMAALACFMSTLGPMIPVISKYHHWWAETDRPHHSVLENVDASMHGTLVQRTKIDANA